VSPRFSVVTPVYEPPLDVLQEAIDSVRTQTFPDWELVLVDDRSPSDAVRHVLRRACAADRRIRVIEREANGGIVAASNDAITAARGEFIALLDHDDLLTPDALEVMARAIDEGPEVDFLYSDENKINEHGSYQDLFRKPDWSPERLRNQMYTGHLSVLRTALVREVGGFRSQFEGSQDWDLALRISEKARRIVHIRQVLYHWRIIPGSAAGDAVAKPYAVEAGGRAVQAHLDRLGIRGRVELSPYPGALRIHREMPRERRVSIVIPTRGSSGMVWGETRTFVVEAIRSALSRTSFTNLEVVVVYDLDTPPHVLDEVRGLVPAGDLVLVAFAKPFNFSEKCNVGVLASSGDVIVLLNDDVQIRSDEWLTDLVAPLEEPDVGMTGARLLFDDGTVQHAGHVYFEGNLRHVHYGERGDVPGIFHSLTINRECSGVTAACAAMRRAVFDEVGGLTEILPVNFNDVDLSLKVRHQGYRIVWMAHAEAYHFESRTRSREVNPFEPETIESRWDVSGADPYLPAQ
jgi:glycosyltransferase involved in cell wall biosynthesis